MEPLDFAAGDAAPCPRCGVYLYPLSWARTWGVALGVIGLTLGGVVAAVMMCK